MYDDAAIDNAQMSQRDTLCEMIDSNEFDQWDLSIWFLRFNRELWKVTNYHYKGRELCMRIVERIRELRGSDTIHWKTSQKYDEYRTVALALADLYGSDEAAWKSKAA